MTKWPIARARQPRIPGSMNKTEERYGQELDLRKHVGEIAEYWFEGMKLRLADNTFYTPDYLVLLPCGEIQVHEVKGFWREDARVKIKVAASLYPFRFVAVKALPKKDGGGWSYEEF